MVLKKNKNILQLFAFLKESYKKKILFFSLKYTKSVFYISNFLLTEGFIHEIRYVTKKKKKYMIFFLNYKFLFDGFGLSKNLKNTEAPFRSLVFNSYDCYSYITADSINTKIKPNLIMVISTDKGYITCRQARKMGLGGILVCKFFI